VIREKIEMVVVGLRSLVRELQITLPEPCLNEHSVIGPQKAAMLEGSKEFAKAS